jgi:hypothetical protein
MQAKAAKEAIERPTSGGFIPPVQRLRLFESLPAASGGSFGVLGQALEAGAKAGDIGLCRAVLSRSMDINIGFPATATAWQPRHQSYIFPSEFALHGPPRRVLVPSLRLVRTYVTTSSVPGTNCAAQPCVVPQPPSLPMRTIHSSAPRYESVA